MSKQRFNSLGSLSSSNASSDAEMDEVKAAKPQSSILNTPILKKYQRVTETESLRELNDQLLKNITILREEKVQKNEMIKELQSIVKTLKEEKMQQKEDFSEMVE